MASSERGIIQPNTFSFEWKIKRFFADCQKVGNFHQSPVFTIPYDNKSTKWSLKVHPKGEKGEGNCFVSLFLHFKSESDMEVIVDIQCSLSEEKNHYSEVKTTSKFNGPSSFWGWQKFHDQETIKNFFTCNDDALTIYCKMTFQPLDSVIFRGYDKIIDNISCGLGDFEKLFNSGIFHDVTFNVQDKKIKAHKNVLSCRNPVFKAMFNHNMKENKQNVVNIVDIHYHVMRELLLFIYSGKVNNVELIAGDLLIAADKYQVTELKALCEKTLYDRITVDIALDYLKLSNMCTTLHLEALVINFIGIHYKEMIKKPEFKTLSSVKMYQIMKAAAENN